MKPKTWRECPYDVLEGILWDCDLEYDSYESSKAERIHEIQNGTIYEDNERIVNTAWSMLSEEDFRQRCKNVYESLVHRSAEVLKYLA
jgi:hypothetical protein